MGTEVATGVGVGSESTPGANTSRTWLAVICSVTNAVFTSGVIYGYPALYPALVDSKVYNELCEPGEDICKAQDSRLTMLFTLSSSVAPFCNILVGLYMDRYGPRLTGMLCAVVFLAGCVLFASSSTSFDGYIPGFTLLGASGPGMFMAGLTLGSKIPEQSGRIMSLHSCGFDASAIVFWFLDKLYFWTDYEATLSILFYSYLIIPVYSFLIFYFLFDKLQKRRGRAGTVTSTCNDDNSEKGDDNDADNGELEGPQIGTREQPKSDELEPVSEDTTSLRRRSKIPSTTRSSSVTSSGKRKAVNKTLEVEGVVDMEHDEEPGSGSRAEELMKLTTLQQMKTPLFILICSTVSGAMLQLNFYIGTIPQQLKHLSNGESVDSMAQWFTVVMAFGAALSAPLVGYSLDKRGLIFSFLTTTAFLFTFQCFTLIPVLHLQWVSVSLMTVTRAYLYSGASNLLGRAFGFHGFGKLYGMMMLCAGAVNFLSIPLASVCINQLDGDFFLVNVSLLAVTASTLLLPLYMKKIGLSQKME
eukprot:Nk52_evm42s158 gene=Nk52_evmTU42s158